MLGRITQTSDGAGTTHGTAGIEAGAKPANRSHMSRVRLDFSIPIRDPDYAAELSWAAGYQDTGSNR
jgi:hypothetical protein